MSNSDVNHKSHETVLESQDGEPAPVYQSSASKSPESENAGRGPAEAATSAEELSELYDEDQTADQIPKASAKQSHASKAQSRIKPRPYRHVLNDSILDTAGQLRSDSYDIGPSQIGASRWTAAEKDAFFRKLAIYGPCDLQSLSAAVRTKSEAEIQVYLHLLQDGVVEANAALPSRQTPATTEAPAAYEIGATCEAELESAADSLAQSLAERDAEKEREKHNEHWLVDAKLADEIEQNLESHATSPKNENEEADNAGHADRENSNNAPFPSANLLRPAAFLQLSYDIYMAGTPGDAARWYESGENIDGLDEPAVFRSAFEDFYNLALSLTRRLVQAIIFQTMTRLRASDSSRMSWTPEPVVRPKDVHAAVDILEMDVNAWSTYWARLPRRQGLIAYSESKKYQDGRPGTKNGVGLSYEEVESELGLPDDARMDGDLADSENVSLDEMDFDSDDFTVISDSDSETGADGTQSKQSIEADAQDMVRQLHEDPLEPQIKRTELTNRERQWATRKLKRKRALSPISFGRAQDAYLDAEDMNASREEEQRLWQSIRKRPPADAQLEPQAVPESPVLNGTIPVQRTDWRDKVAYEAPWERFGAPVPEVEFVEMGRCGVVGRKRRRVFRERLVEEGGRVVEHDDGVDETSGSAESLASDEEDSIREEAAGSEDESAGDEDIENDDQ